MKIKRVRAEKTAKAGRIRKGEKPGSPSGDNRRIKADMRVLLLVFALVLLVMGIFAWAFRQIHVGYVEENGHVVTSSELYDRLSRGSENAGNILLSAVYSNDEVFLRGGKYYVGQEMTEYESVYPLYANSGLALYFMNDTAKLVSEDFEFLDTYQGMFVSDGTSFNADHSQADVETIYLVKLKNGLYANALSVTLTRDNLEEKIPVNSIVNFGETCIRYYDEQSGLMEYHALEDVSGITVRIQDKSFSYVDFLEALKGAESASYTGGASTPLPKPETDPEDEEEETPVSIVQGGEGPAASPEAVSPSEDPENAEKERDQSTKESSAAAGGPQGSQGAGSNSSSGGSGGSGDSGSGDSSDAAGGQAGGSTSRPGGSSSAEPPYQKPTVTVKGVTMGTYTLTLDVDIQDGGGYLKKLTARVLWDNGTQRKSVRESGSYTIGNLESGQKVTLVIEMKYKSTTGDYVTEEVYLNTELWTLSIEDGTNTLYLDYLPDTWTAEKGGGYEQIFPSQIEIRQLTVEEGNDSKVEDESPTMDYVRYFRIKLYDAGGSDTEPVTTFTLSNADKKKMLMPRAGEGGTEEGSEDGGAKEPEIFKGLNWKSDQTMSPLESDKNYYYEFELLDRYEAPLKVVYRPGEDDFDRYGDDGSLLTLGDSDRKAYTCKEHPMGKLTMGSASYDSQAVTVSLENPDLSVVSDLYLTVQDTYQRYVEYEEQGGKALGRIGTGVLTDDARFMFKEGVVSASTGKVLPLYLGVADAGYDAGKEKQSWEKVQIPSFANTTYTISLNISYNIGDRYGDVDENGERTGVYTKALAVRSNCKTTSLNTLGNVSFSRGSGNVYSDSVNYHYTSTEISEKLLPLIYRYNYTLKNTADEKDTPLDLRISKELEEIGDTRSQGVILSIPGYGEEEAKEWSFGYTYSYRERTDLNRTVHTVSGKISWDGSKVTRTILVDGEPKGSVESTADDFYAAFAELLDLDTCAKILNDTGVQESSIVVESAVNVTLDFDPILDKDGSTVIKDINKDYAVGMPSGKLKSAFEYMANEADRDFSDVLLCALSRYQAPLDVTVSGLKSAQIYQAEAQAYAYQSGDLEAKTDENGEIVYGEAGAPKITLMTTTDTSLQLQTLKGEPQVHMELFSTTTELTLFDFYVLDKDGAIVPKKNGMEPGVTVSVYEYREDPETGEGIETLVARRTGLSPAASQEETVPEDLVFSGLKEGQLYRIKVTAEAYDVTPDGSAVQYDYLIGRDEGSTFWKENGVWENVVGTAVTTDLTLEEVLKTDPYTLENQLIDFTSSDVEGGGWELGNLESGSGTVVSNQYDWTTPYMDLRGRDKDGNPVALTKDDTFVMRAVSGRTVFYYDKDKNYLGSQTCYATGSGSDLKAIFKLPERGLSGNGSKDYKIEDIVYARVSISYVNTNRAFFGRLDEGYLTVGTTDDQVGNDFTDVWNSIRNAENLWDSLGTERETASYGTTAGDTVTLANYYKNAISVQPGQVFLFAGRTDSASLERNVAFLDSAGRVISMTGEPGQLPARVRYVYPGILYTVPETAVEMRVQYKSQDSEPRDRAMYVFAGGIKDAYDDWRNELHMYSIGEVTPTAGRDSGEVQVAGRRAVDGARYVVRDAQYEATSWIPVKEGDIYLVSNWGQGIYYFDAAGTYKYGSGGLGGYSYVVIPEGIAYMKLTNYRVNKGSLSNDLSLVNGKEYNEGGSYPIIMLKCGNIKSVYEEKADGMYANLRIQLKDGVNNYFTDGLSQNGSYWLEVHKVKYEGEEISDQELNEAPAEKTAEGVIHVLRTEEGSRAEEINRCRTIPVTPGYSYKVVLYASIGERSAVELGDVYFTVREEGTPVYGLSGAVQISSIRSDVFGDYVLNKDLTMDSRLYVNGGTFYGVLDLQGHTLTNARNFNIFDAIGSVAKKQGTIKNGTLVFSAVRDGTSMSRLTGNSYGTLENIHFKVDCENPYTVSGKDKIYDNSRWASQNVVYFLNANYGTIRNFTIEYQADLVSCQHAGFMMYNSGLVENGYIYGDGCIMGGSYVGGLVCVNNSVGVVRGIYSTIDSKSNSNALGGNVTTTYACGTIIGDNRGKAEGLLATGNVYQYAAVRNGSNYVFTSEAYYPNKGCAVGITTNRMDTSRTYYATVGGNRRINYQNAYNDRVEGGLLTDPAWFRTLFGEGKLNEEYLEELLTSGYYPWVDMGAAAEKYSILQPYLVLDTSASAGFDLIKSEVLEYTYDKDGFASARVKFTLTNPSSYEVTDVMLDGLDCQITGQSMNDTTGFYEAEGVVQVTDGGDYVTGYDVKSVYYRRTANSSKSSVRYSYGSYVSTNGSRTVDASFYYPLRNTREWTEIFNKDHSAWNFRIWGDEVWDFEQKYTCTASNGLEYQRYPSPVRNFAYTGHLDGTLYEEGEDGRWEPALSEDGQVRCHVLKNLFDYSISYNTSGNINGYGVYGYVLSAVSGGISNLIIEDLSVGIERPVHRQEKEMSAAQLADVRTALPTPWGAARQTKTGTSRFGLIAYLNPYGTLENVHVEGAYLAPVPNGSTHAQHMGVLAGSGNGYNTYTRCSVTDATIITSDTAGAMSVGGLVGRSESYSTFLESYSADLDLQAQASTFASFGSGGVGGLVGYTAGGLSLTGCYSSGNLDSEVVNVGGLVGSFMGASSVDSCYSAMNLSTSGANAGGLAGRSGAALNISSCLYTGSLSAASSSNTIHLMVGYNISSLSLEDCYAYQPQRTEEDVLVDAGVTLKSYGELTGSTEFYENLFGDYFIFDWGSYGTSAEKGAYLPALAASVETEDGSGARALLAGQVYAGICYVPAIPEESLKVTDVWAFSSEDRGTGLQDASEGLISGEKWYENGLDGFHQLLTNAGAEVYDPNDIEFTLVLGDRAGRETPTAKVFDVTVEGLAEGGLLSDNYTDASGLEGVFGSDGSVLTVKTFRCEIAPDPRYADQFAYRIRLLGTEVISYRDLYNVVVTLDNGVVLKETFQFRAADGTEDAKFLTISNAWEWNLYMGESGVIPAAAADPNASEELQQYKGWNYKGYANASMNVEIAGDVDFSVLDGLKELGEKKAELPVVNVLANNVRGRTGINDSGSQTLEGSVRNLTRENVSNADYGLFKSISGSLKDLVFEDNTLRWKASGGAPSGSGLLGTVSGGVKNCRFENTVLTGGSNTFGVIGSCDGVIEDVTVVNSFVESDSCQVGGLVGVLRGDLVNVEAYGTDDGEYGYDVAGTYNVGGLVGSLLTTPHETNGHEIIGGADYTTTIEEGEERPDLNPEGWYSTNMVRAGNNYENNSYTYDSLSDYYALVQDVKIYNAGVTAQMYRAGGVAGTVSYMSMGPGYTYVIGDGIQVGRGTDNPVRVAALRRHGNTLTYVGGLFGDAGSFMLHDITLDGADLDGADGDYVGGLVGYGAIISAYEYSGYYDSENRIGTFLCAADQVTVKNSVVSGANRVGGLAGNTVYFTNLHDITAENNVTLGAGSYVGGLMGYGQNIYMTDAELSGQQVYNSGTEISFTGGLAGALGGGGIRRFHISDVQVTAAGESSYTAGVVGNGGHGRNTAEDERNSIQNVTVYGHDYVGGVNNNGLIYYTDAEHIRVIGTGDYVGGLCGVNGSYVCNTAARDLTVIGGGVATGGVFGHRTGSNFSNSQVEDVTVIASGSAVSDAPIYIGTEQRTGLTAGSCVGGIAGATSGSNFLYLGIENVTVYGSGDYVGGLCGVTYTGYLGELSAQHVKVHGDGSYVGGAVGHQGVRYSNYKVMMDDVQIYAPRGSYVGGMTGYMTVSVSASTTNYFSMIKSVIDLGDSNGSYVGGLVGYSDDIYSFIRNAVETTIKAPKASCVGGLIGYVNRTAGKNFYCHSSYVAADVTGADYVSGMIGSAGDYELIGANGVYSGVYKNLVAAKATATEGEHISYFYRYEKDGEPVKDVNNTAANVAYPQPHSMMLWDESTLTTPDTGTVKATEQTFRSYNNQGLDNKPAKYWRGTNKTGVEKYTSTGVYLGLVSTEDMANPQFYYGATDHMGLSVHTAVTADDEGNAVFDDMENMMINSDVWNRLGLYEGATDTYEKDGADAEHYLYMPIPLNPLLLCRELAQNVDGVDHYVEYFFGTAERAGDDTLKFRLHDAICVPGTEGSVLTGTNESSSGALADIDLKSAPKLYAGNAYTLNVEFGDADVYAGAWLEVYEGVGEEKSSEPVYTVQTQSGEKTYSMYYDFKTPVTVELASGAYHDESVADSRYVAYAANVDPYAFRSRVCPSSTLLYSVGSDGKLYSYAAGWSTADERVATVNEKLEDDERIINIALESAGTVSVLTDKGKIICVTGSGSDKQLPGTVGGLTAITMAQSGAGLPAAGCAARPAGEGITGPEGSRLIASAGSIPSGVFTSADLTESDDLSGEPDKPVEPDEDLFVEPESGDDGLAAGAENGDAGDDGLTTEPGSGDAGDDGLAVEPEFDEGLLTAEPLYEFDYKGYHICTYLTYSLIFDEDQVTVRNMQLFVKNGQLFALNAPDEVVPGGILIDSYQGHTYMTVLTRDGKMTDLMDAINYPENFVNRNIKNIGSNLYSDLTYVQVEYEDGGIITFNYLTGGVVYSEEGGGEEGDENGQEDFLSFIMGFFRDKLNTAYAEVSSAYQNALAMQDYLSTQPWRDWFVQDGQSYEDGMAEDKEGQDNLNPFESRDGGLLSDENETNEDVLPVTEPELTEPEQAGAEALQEAGTSGQGVSGGTEDILEGTLPENPEGDASEHLAGGMTEGIPEGETEEIPGAESQSEQFVGEPDSQASGSGPAENSDEGEVTFEEGEAAVQKPETGGALADELIIAYDADAKGYAVYSAGDLLTQEEEQLVSVDQQMQRYLDKGGTLRGSEPQIESLQVDRTQQKGLVILLIIGGAIGFMLIILGIQRYSRKDAGRRR